MATRRKKGVRRSKKVAKFIIELLEQGKTVAEIAREHPRKVPSREAIQRWIKDDAEFREDIKAARESVMFMLQDELDELTRRRAPSLEEVMEEYKLDDIKQGAAQLRAVQAQIKLRTDALRFFIKDVAPRVSPSEFGRQEPESKETTRTINIINYSRPESQAPEEEVVHKALEQDTRDLGQTVNIATWNQEKEPKD